MREIKFRVYDKKGSKMLRFDVLQKFALLGLIFTKLKQYQVMQYTGLKDKNGVEIYEGDIVKVVSGYIWEQISDVVWGLADRRFGNYPAFSMPEIETELNSFSEVFDSGDYEVEVIGNIYENPELLDTKKSS